MAAAIMRLVGLLGLSRPATAPTVAPGPVPEDPVVQAERKAIDDFRTLAKWLLTIFASVAALLLAGVQLSGLGHLSVSDPRLWLAVASGALTLAALAVILWQFVGVLTPVSTSIKKLAETEACNSSSPDITYLKDNGLLGDHPSVGELYEAFRKPGADPAVAIRVQRVIMVVLRQQVWQRFRRAFSVALPVAVLAALFIAGFVWAANPPAASAGPFEVPADADLVLDQAAQTTLRDQLGPSCVASPVHVVVLSAESGLYDVVSVPSTQCKVARFTIGRGPLGVSGTLVRRNPVTITNSPTR